ncbi:hypothetical protein BC826DRAFT_973227 [Russula brevipes]|nr:hypothetical protein BC826DRAFT_973227 [Russula brevipes]
MPRNPGRDRALMQTSEGKHTLEPRIIMMHGRPPEPPSLHTRSSIAWAPNCVVRSPKQVQLVDLDGGEGARGDSWPQPGSNIEGQDVYLGASALLEGEQNNLLLVGSKQAVTRPTPNLAQIPGMPNLGLPSTPAEEADEGAGATANSTDPAYGVFNVPGGPRGLEHALAITKVDSEAAELRMVESRRRTNWPAQENATKPRPPSQKPTRTTEVLRESRPGRA